MKVLSQHAESVFSEKQKQSLLTLLNDEDPAVYLAVRERILSFGEEALTWIRPHTLSRDPILRRRALEIVRFFEQMAADTEFLQFCLTTGENSDLEHGAFLLARTEFPEINVAAYQALLDSYASDIRETLLHQAQPEAIIATMNEFVFIKQEFCGNESNYYDPENSYLNRVMDRKKGNPINLCLLYLLLARRLNLPMTGIGLPGHFICRFQDASEAFYIDVFNQGRILTKTDCIHYLIQTPSGYRRDFLAPMASRRILMRICANLHLIYIRMHAAEESKRLHSYVVALSR